MLDISFNLNIPKLKFIFNRKSKSRRKKEVLDKYYNCDLKPKILCDINPDKLYSIQTEYLLVDKIKLFAYAYHILETNDNFDKTHLLKDLYDKSFYLFLKSMIEKSSKEENTIKQCFENNNGLCSIYAKPLNGKFVLFVLFQTDEDDIDFS